MTITRTHVMWVAVAIVGILAWQSMFGRDGNTIGTPPQWQESGTGIAAWRYGKPTGGVWDHPEYKWRVPRHHGMVVTRHRYPVRTGGELSAIIRDGMAGFTNGPPIDRPWLANPPSVDMW